MNGHKVYRYLKGGPVHGAKSDFRYPGSPDAMTAAKCLCGWESTDVAEILEHEKLQNGSRQRHAAGGTGT